MSLHCWTGYREHIEATFGQWSPEHCDTFQEDYVDSTCMLEAGHEGPHEWTPDDAIGIRFVDPEPNP